MEASTANHGNSRRENPDIQSGGADCGVNRRPIRCQAEISDKLPDSAAEPKETGAPPKLYFTKGPMEGHEYEIKGKVAFIGRSSNNDVQIKDIMVSRKHLKISRSGETFSVEDLMSSNGTQVNGETIVAGENIEMTEGDTICLGSTWIQFGRIPVKDTVDVCSPAGITGFGKDRRASSPKDVEFEKLSRLFEQSLSVHGMLEKLLEYLLESLPRVDNAAILLIQEQADTRKIKELVRKSKRNQADEVGHYSRGLLKRLIKDGKTIKVSNTTFESQPGRSKPENLDTANTSSTLCVPIMSSKEIRGAIYLNSASGPYEGFRKEDLSMLDSMGELAAVAIDNANILNT
jgi:pSer/pThr/pTyr-binding forkhead associated (FHA) protein